ncbi:MAG: hypothetical protein LBC86_01975 [Oscillospiraceae bacterium]|jgi:hypothetical protein|nr:hypothetical protein [Oscillospiraceae bacterium]
MKKNAKIIAAAAVVLLLLSALIFDAKNMTGAIVRSIETCLYTIIPALFGFMVISSYLLRSGLYRILFKPLYLILRCVIRLNEEEFGIFLLSLFGGYPVGAKLAAENKLTRNILPYCYCPSPGFVISTAGFGLFSNSRAGLAVYLSNVLACVILSVLLNIRRKDITDEKSRPPLQLNAFTPAVMSAGSALFPVCAVIVAFGVIKGTLQFIGIESTIIFAVLEISSISQFVPNPVFLPFIAALFSTGGLCILMQIPAILGPGAKAKNKIPLRGFFWWRIPAALLSAAICRLLMPFIDFTAYIPVSTAETAVISTQAGSPIASAALLIMAVILVRTAGESASA